MYDELVKRLRSEAVYLPEKFSKNAELLDALMKAADAIEELTRENESLAKSVNEASDILRRRWIPVTERLPKEEETVLAFGTLGVAWLDWRHDNKWCCYGGVTHWMPLPQPPKEE